MRFCKLLLITIITTLSMPKGVNGQYVQSMGYKDYSFWEHVNIGNRGAKTTNGAAYLELGKPTGSNKGFLLPRGNKDSIVSPTYGMVFYNNPDSSIYFFDGVAWKNISKPEGAPGDGNNYINTLSYNPGTDALTVGRNGLSNLTASIPLSIKENAANKSTSTTLNGVSANNTRYPTELAVKTFVENAVASAGAGTATVKAFTTINALKTSSFHTTPGDLKADILDGGRSFKWNGESTASDDGGVTTVVPTTGAGAWERIFRGVVRADEVGIKNDGTDQTSALNSLFALSTVKEVVFDNGTVKISGKVNAQNKNLRFENAAMLNGTTSNGDTLANAFIIANKHTQIFDTTLNVSGLDQEIYATWFGAKADYKYDGTTVGPTDNYGIFKKALASLKDHYNGVDAYYLNKSKLNIPGGADSYYYYYLSNTLIIDAEMEVYGDGWTQTKLKFPNGVKGIWIRYPDVTGGTYKGSSNAKLHDIALYGSTNASTDDISHGIYIDANFVTLDHIIVYDFKGDGVYVEGHAPSSNANNCVLNYVRAFGNARHGIHLSGADANQCVLTHCDANSNGEIGVYDNSFLGNSHNAIHTADNGIFYPYNKTMVTYAGDRWVCIQPNTGKRPDLEPTYWTNVGSASGYPSAWDTTIAYRASAGYKFDNANQNGTVSDCYSEGGQWPLINSSNNIFLGGTLGGSSPAIAGLTSSNGILATQALKTWGSDNVSALMYGLGLNFIGFSDVSTSTAIGFKYSQTNRAFSLSSSIGSNGSLWFYSVNTPAGVQGRTVARGNTMGFDNPPLFKNESSGGWNILGYKNSVPTSGDYEAGDFYIYGGTDGATIAYRCTAAGNPGTWVTLSAGASSLPDQTGHSGEYLTTNGTTASWTAATGSGAAGANKNIQYNNSGAFAGTNDFLWDNTAKRLELNDASFATMSYKIGGSYIWSFEGYTDLRWYNWNQSRYSFIHSQRGFTTIDPDPTATSADIGLELKGSSRAKFPQVHVGNGTMANASLSLENSTGLDIIENNSAGLDFYRNSTLALSVTGTGARVAGSSKYLNFNSTNGSTGYGFRDNAGTMEFKNSGGSWTAIGAGGGGASGLADPGSNGIVIRTAANTTVARSIVTGVGIGVNSGDGVSANIQPYIKGWQEWNNTTAQTTNTTATTIAIYSCPLDGSGTMVVEMVATKTDNTKSLEGRKTIHWHSVAGTVTVDEIVDEVADYLRGFTTATWTVDANTGNLRIRATGEASTTVDWSPTYKIKYNSY